MSLYAMSEPIERATFRAQLALRDLHKHDVEHMFAAIEQHPAAMLGSAVDDCWIAALAAAPEPCPYCCAAPGEPCRFDCSSRFEGNES